IEKISIEDKFFEFLEQEDEEKKEENEEKINLPFTLLVENFEANLYDFVYEEQKIDELVLKSKNISSDLKDFVSAEIFTNIKSNIANFEANINIDKNIYKLQSKIDLKEYVKTTFNVQANGDLEKVEFIVKNDVLKIEQDKQIVDIKDIKLFGNYNLKSFDLDITKLDALLKYNEISSNIKANASMKNNEIDSLLFDVDLQTSIKKSISELLQKDLQVNTKINGNLKKIKFFSKVEENSIKIDEELIKIENIILDGIANINDKNIDILSDFNVKTNLANKKSKVELKLNLDKPEDLAISAKSLIQNLNYKNFNLKQLGDININSSYKKSFLAINLNSKLANLELKSFDLKKFIFDLDIKDLNPNNFYELDKVVQISKIRGNIKGEYQENLSLDAALILNDTFKIDSNIKTNQDNIEAFIKNSSFQVLFDKKADLTKIKTNINELKNLEKELAKIIEVPALGLEGEVDLDLQMASNSLNNLNFKVNSPKIKFENEEIEKIEIEGNLKDKTVFLDKLNFNIGEIYDINLQKNFSLLNQAFFNLENFNGNFNFDNILINTSKEDKNIVLNVDTKNLKIGHNSYGKGILNSNINININEQNKISVQGEINVRELNASYNIPAMSISKDKDIIIVSKKNKSESLDYFFENVALELIVISNDIKYSVKNIDLKVNAILNIKKEFSKELFIYGSVNEIDGTFSELGKTYKIENSGVYFRGLSDNPILDIKASTKVEDIDITILISGSLNNPRINLNSNPVMNQKDILSYLIFGTTFSNTSENTQSRQSQASLFLLNELSKDYAKELGVDTVYFQYDGKTQYIETHIGKNISEKSKVVLKNKAQGGQVVLMRELTKLWNVELGFEEKTQSLDLMYKKKY
ncbi:MAG: translocation/assembly module TamB domain-containing protein, partial [Aliarcobacter sp.]|nr:translocation/assembly module TamB domain-containing protein [Aliarcobacter sp.]